jgi:hypothetical protein
MAAIVATADPVTGSILVNIDRRLVLDTFSRVVGAGSWGSASEVGGAYTLLGGTIATDYAVNGTVGQMILGTTAVTRSASLLSGLTDMSIKVDIVVPVNPTGAPIDAGILIRNAGLVAYRAKVRLNTDTTATLTIQYRDGGGTFFDLSDEILIPNFTVGASNAFSVAATISGDLIRAKAWVTADAEPQTWLVEARNSERVSGTVGLYAIRNSGNTNGSTTVTFDNFEVQASVEPLNLWRHTPDGTQVLVRGSGFFTDPFDESAVFWDNEAPFDVDVFYTLRSSDSDTDTITSNTVNLASGGDIWLRDPYNPSLNLIIEIDDTPFDYCVDDPKIMFADLLGRVYSSASGIFDIIDTQRPETIAQTRKRYASTLVLTSKEPEDGEAIEAIVAGGYPLLLSLPVVYQFGLPYGTDWITIFDIDQQPVGVDRRVPARVWSLPFRLALPAADVDTGNTGGNGIGAGGATYDDLMASAIGLTYTSLDAAGFTYTQIAAGTGY